MKLIEKNSKYISKWLSLYKDPDSTYKKDIKDKRERGKNNYDHILENLLEEQDFLCAYCMRKISNKNSTIEHFIGQECIDDDGVAIGKREDTNYQNMLAVCLGNYCKKITKNQEKLHCDSSRSNFQSQDKPNYRPKLFISPLDKRQMKQIGFTRTGVLFYGALDRKNETNDEKEIRYDLEEVLNLNCVNLQEGRKRVIRIIDSSLGRHNYDKKFAQKELAFWRAKNNEEYCQVAICKLEKFLKGIK